jgi:L-threonylcarbamoyladenylate synthase
VTPAPTVPLHDVLARGAALDRIGEALSRGGIVAYPTETFYGLGVDATSAAAVERLVVAKGRPRGNPIPLIIARARDLAGIARDIPEVVHFLAARFWPGPLTLVLCAVPALPEAITAGTGKVGARVSGHPVAAAIAEACAFPITATSANVSGAPPARRPDEISGSIRDALDLLVNGGSTPGGPASTVLDVTEDPPRILREGPITGAEIRAALRAR